MKLSIEEGPASDELSRKLNKVVRALEKLEALEDIVILGDKFYQKHPSKTAEQHLQDKFNPYIQAKLSLQTGNVEVGESVAVEIEMQNLGRAPALLIRIDDIIPKGFELVEKPNAYDSKDTSLDMRRKQLDPYITEYIKITLRPIIKGMSIMSPRIVYTSKSGRQMSSELEPAAIKVTETVLPDRVSTGFKDLDSLLFGGIPEKYAVVLTSVSCDERELLIKRFLEAGIKDQNVTFYVTINAIGVRSLAEEFKSNFYVFVCNPQVDSTLEGLPNVFMLRGVENLTDINIALESACRKLDVSQDSVRRACIEIISDVLLQHRAIQTRRWLSSLIPELRSRGFTILGVINPRMHPQEETHAILDLFEGEINIYDKEMQKEATKFLRITKMYNQTYLESELPLSKAKLRGAPSALPCCARESKF